MAILPRLTAQTNSGTPSTVNAGQSFTLFDLLSDVAARLGIVNENAHRATDDAEAAMRVLYAFGKDARVPRQYAPFIQEQRRLAMAQADARQRIPFRGR